MAVHLAAAATLALLLAASPASAQSARAPAFQPARLGVGLAAGAAVFTGAADGHGNGPTLAAGLDARLGDRFAVRGQFGAGPASQLTVGVARELHTLPDDLSFLSLEIGLAFLEDHGWRHGAYTDAGVQLGLGHRLALTFDSKVYFTSTNAGFSLLGGVKVYVR